jgi:hypothetical protein
MIKKRIQNYIFAGVVGFSILSFAYVNFFSGNTNQHLTAGELLNRTEQSANVDKDEVDTEKGSDPDIAVLVRLLSFAKKFVPTGH